MLFGIFSNIYCFCRQQKFSKAIKEYEYLRAREILERLPEGKDTRQKDIRQRVIIEGYRALTEKMMDDMQMACDWGMMAASWDEEFGCSVLPGDFDKFFTEQMRRLLEYEKFGTPDDIRDFRTRLERLDMNDEHWLRYLELKRRR
jgi:hypothetical protein